MFKNKITLFLFVLLLVGLFWSRALLSITQALWVIYALVQLKKNKAFLLSDPLLVWSIAPLVLWLLGAYQQPLAMANYDYALTLAIYPATVLVTKTIPPRLIEKKLLLIWLMATAVGLIYPLFWYLTDMVNANKMLGSGQALPTFMDTDHVRFSIFLCSSFLMLICFPLFKHKLRVTLILLLLIAILFLSVRTGWILLLAIIFIFTFLYLKDQQRIKPFQILGGLLSLVLLIVVAYYLFPSMQQKIAYSIWDWQQFKPGNFDANYSDGTRRAINYAAYKSIQTGNGSNTGWAGITAALTQSLSDYFSGTKSSFGWPFNQWLFWWMGSGWWGAVLFTGWLFYPAFYGWKKKNIGLICWSIAIAISCMAEATLNYQFGVFLHVWPIAFFWQYQSTSTPDNS